MAYQGIYFTDDVARARNFEQNVGLQMDVFRVANWNGNDSQFEGINYMMNIINNNMPWAGCQYCCVPFKLGGNWAAAASGAYDAAYGRMADLITINNNKSGPLKYGDEIIISYGYELNGYWWYCAVDGQYEYYKQAAVRFANIVKAKVPRAKICLNWVQHGQNVNSGGNTRAQDMWVDGPTFSYIGMNFYYKPSFMGSNPDAVWNYWLTAGAAWTMAKNFANSKGLKFIIPELGISSFGPGNTTETYDLRAFCDRMADKIINEVYMVLYWFGWEDYDGMFFNYGGRGDRMPLLRQGMVSAVKKIRNAALASGGTTPPVTPPPTTTPAEKALALLKTIHEGAYNARSQNFVDPAGAARTRVEDIAWRSRVTAGDLPGQTANPAGKAPLDALADIYAIIRDRSGWQQSAVDLMDPWRTAAEPILAEAGKVPPLPTQPTLLHTLVPVTINFADTTVNTTSQQLTAKMTNTGTGNLSITNVAKSGANADDFTVTHNAPTGGLYPNTSFDITVTFKPTAVATRNATITITTNSTSTAKTIALSGKGIAEVVVPPDPVDPGPTDPPPPTTDPNDPGPLPTTPTGVDDQILALIAEAELRFPQFYATAVRGDLLRSLKLLVRPALSTTPADAEGLKLADDSFQEVYDTAFTNKGKFTGDAENMRALMLNLSYRYLKARGKITV
jgi:hypothetical protein